MKLKMLVIAALAAFCVASLPCSLAKAEPAKAQVYSVIASAQADQVVPMPSPLPEIGTVDNIKPMADAVTGLIQNWKAYGPLGIASAILVLLILFLNSSLCGNWFGAQTALIKRALILLFGQAIAVLGAIAAGTVWYVAVVSGLFVSGGAIALFEVLKPLFQKPQA
jgi:hypothetical protein